MIVDFWAEWCGPCKMIVPLLDEIAREKAGAVKIAKVNVDENQSLSFKYNIRAIPALLFFKNGQLRGSGSACEVTITVDITPLIVNVGGLSFDGSAALPAQLASPVFATSDYGAVPFATAAVLSPRFPRGPSGPLSQLDAGNLLQLQDATIRARFNKVGASNFHLRLNPVVHDTVTIDV